MLIQSQQFIGLIILVNILWTAVKSSIPRDDWPDPWSTSAVFLDGVCLSPWQEQEGNSCLMQKVKQPM